jgi:hypothetical protein
MKWPLRWYAYKGPGHDGFELLPYYDEKTSQMPKEAFTVLLAEAFTVLAPVPLCEVIVIQCSSTIYNKYSSTPSLQPREVLQYQ